MFVVLLILLLIVAILLLLLCFRMFKWTLKNKKRVQLALIVFIVGGVSLVINHFFFKNMRFIQSQIYPNLYLVKYPDRDYTKVQTAIREKITEHFKTEHKTGKPLAYRNENGIYFYELGGRTFGFIGEAGTGYFLDHEEDLGGFVSEELGMYTDYRLAEFYYDPCAQDSTLVCGEIGWYREGEYFKAEALSELKTIKPVKKSQETAEQYHAQVLEERKEIQEEKLPLHGVLDKEAVAKYYPGALDAYGPNGNFYAERIPLTNNNGDIISLLHHIESSTDFELYTHNNDLEFILRFKLGKATDFDQGKSVTIDYNIQADSSIVFNEVIWGTTDSQEEETIDTLAHKIVTIRITDKGEIDWSISQNPEYYVLEVYNTGWDPNGINLRDGPNGTIIKTLERPEYGYIFSIVRGENDWFRVLKIDTVDDGEIKMTQGVLWIHSSVIGIRTNWDASILDAPKKGKQMGLVPADTDLRILDLKSGRVKIEYQGKIGWVDAQMLCGNPVTTCP